jgi:ATP-dependent RNA helicase DDX42
MVKRPRSDSLIYLHCSPSIFPFVFSSAAALHGDVAHNERTQVSFAFQHGHLPILVATDLASRGLDIKNIKTVINFEVPRNIETHIHRIGRTGRMGDKEGTAITLITKNETNFAGDLVRNLEASNQVVPPELMTLAMQASLTQWSRGESYQAENDSLVSYSQNSWFRKQRPSDSNRSRAGIGAGGAGGSGTGVGGNRAPVGQSGRGRGRGVGFSGTSSSSSIAPTSRLPSAPVVGNVQGKGAKMKFGNLMGSFVKGSSND